MSLLKEINNKFYSKVTKLRYLYKSIKKIYKKSTNLIEIYKRPNDILSIDVNGITSDKQLFSIEVNGISTDNAIIFLIRYLIKKRVYFIIT